ncbi:HPr family phosphocarrier protein [Aureibacillus halotolerans]|uniref:Phosphocarrier protein n=1 Tax=Aureibacillus halotolerans TaxID=1508390 RepID=A0A4R6U567_9BACI|nr:HPr family phosphocarrier protein [Aureibacillus halotolerans]TDQ41618.1 phosphocarrier protein [Aureibacillus halotolerans]
MKVKVLKPVFAEVAGQLVNTASQHSETILIKKGDWVVDAKSLLGVLALSLQPDQEVEITTTPEDQTAAEESLLSLGIFERSE